MTYDPGAGYPPRAPNDAFQTNAPGSAGDPQQQGIHLPPIDAAQQATSVGNNQLFLTVLFVILAFTAGWFGNSFVNGNASTPASARPYASTIWQAWDDIDQNYVDTSAINHQQMTYAMISAMVNTLGDTGHSRFETPDEVKQLNQQLNGASFVGIGVYLQTIQTAQGSVVIVEATIPGSPADKVGLLPGDEILKVDSTNVVGKSIDDLTPLITGKAGTTVTITIQRPGESTTRAFPIVRGDVTAPIVEQYYFASDHIGYVLITGFNDGPHGYSDGAAQEFTDALNQLKTEGMTSLILDLRDNPGGLVQEAIGVASDLLPTNTTIVQEKDRSGAITLDKTTKDGLHLNIPMDVLVDGGTASAAEIVTGALQDDRNITVIGEQTFGTDTVLVPFNLPDGSQLLLGIRQFLTPDGRQFKPGTGLIPTKTVALPQNSFPINPLVLKELNLGESDVLNCKGLTVDTQLLAAIATLEPQHTASCAPAGS